MRGDLVEKNEVRSDELLAHLCVASYETISGATQRSCSFSMRVMTFLTLSRIARTSPKGMALPTFLLIGQGSITQRGKPASNFEITEIGR